MRVKSKIKRIISLGMSEISSFLKDDCSSRVLIYHSVEGETIQDESGVFNISQNNFDGHMRQLSHDKNFCFGELKKIFEPKHREGLLCLTFDDGYADNLDKALPVLERYGIPATIFVACRFVQNGDKRFLSAQNLIRLAKHPLITIGSHGLDHLSLADCNKLRLKQELAGSKSFLEDLIGKRVDFLSYPNGSFSDAVKLAAQESGYLAAFTSRTGSLLQGVDNFEISRVNILGIDSKQTLKRKVTGAWDWHGRFFLRKKDNV
ncbi:polysaccharide deacetylase family protein [Alphaproteobacteria bacterium]|nr:polysaccharide deacetylase family protein [Alphaproteobacteria bacterium]